MCNAPSSLMFRPARVILLGSKNPERMVHDIPFPIIKITHNVVIRKFTLIAVRGAAPLAGAASRRADGGQDNFYSLSRQQCFFGVAKLRVSSTKCIEPAQVLELRFTDVDRRLDESEKFFQIVASNFLFFCGHKPAVTDAIVEEIVSSSRRAGTTWFDALKGSQSFIVRLFE